MKAERIFEHAKSSKQSKIRSSGSSQKNTKNFQNIAQIKSKHTAAIFGKNFNRIKHKPGKPGNKNMGHITEIGKTICFFCKKEVSRNGFGFTSHMRKHVREGIAFEIGMSHPEYKERLEFINLRYRAKVGTIPCVIVFDKPYKLEIGKKVSFRYEEGGKYMSGIITDINIPCIFLELF